jgi:hypothetical protein
MAVVNSDQEAESLRHLYITYGPVTGSDTVTNPEVPPPTETPANATVHIGFHDLFIEGEYLTVRGK